MGRLTRFFDWSQGPVCTAERRSKPATGAKTVEIHKGLVYYAQVFGGKALLASSYTFDQSLGGVRKKKMYTSSFRIFR